MFIFGTEHFPSFSNGTSCLLPKFRALTENPESFFPFLRYKRISNPNRFAKGFIGTKKELLLAFLSAGRVFFLCVYVYANSFESASRTRSFCSGLPIVIRIAFKS
uniref:Uncharacterized protein n=1 Tax=Leptospira ellisii TaxID=2023197 RepID=A0A2N0BD17_9LEPT|nr:hypothetical protein CH379_02460 [Leptospira ellisii]